MEKHFHVIRINDSGSVSMWYRRTEEFAYTCADRNDGTVIPCEKECEKASFYVDVFPKNVATILGRKGSVERRFDNMEEVA